MKTIIKHMSFPKDKFVKFSKTALIICLILLCLSILACKQKKKKTTNFNQRPATMQEIPPPPSPAQPPANQSSGSPTPNTAPPATQPKNENIPVYELDGKPITEMPSGHQQSKPPAIPTPPPTATPSAREVATQTAVPYATGEYTAQLISSKNRTSVETVKTKLAAAKYETEITEAYINGELMYRLRLSGSFSKDYAEYLAKEIQAKFTEVTGYWITKKE